MQIIRANHFGMCFGVRNAIAIACKESETGEVTVLGELVHNNVVIEFLRSRGIKFANKPEEINGKRVIITAHGAGERTLKKLTRMGFNVVEATCPLVKYAHWQAKELVKGGYHPVIIGKREHVEVKGITEDLEEYDVIISEEDVFNLRHRAKYGVIAQTTQPIERVKRLVELLKLRFPDTEVKFVDTVCKPTKLRQIAAVELALKCDVVIVVGGKKSNNTLELASTCAKYCKKVYMVETERDLMEEWFDGSETIGITAGASTPDSVVEAVEMWLNRMANKNAIKVQNPEPVHIQV